MRLDRSALTSLVCMVALSGSGGAAAGETATISQVQKYCTASWSRAGIARQDWQDCTQETVLRLLTRVPRERLDVVFEDAESPERRELHRAVWRTVQRWRRAPRSQALDDQALVAAEAPTTEDDRDGVLDNVWHTITPRQQQILTLWSQGWSVREIAGRLGIPAARVSDEKYKGLGKLREQLL